MLKIPRKKFYFVCSNFTLQLFIIDLSLGWFMPEREPLTYDTYSGHNQKVSTPPKQD